MTDREKSDSVFDSWAKMNCEDEKHMACALHYLQQAIAMRLVHGINGNYGSSIHRCLRDASVHLECARTDWTKEALERNAEIEARLFPPPPL